MRNPRRLCPRGERHIRLIYSFSIHAPVGLSPQAKVQERFRRKRRAVINSSRFRSAISLLSLGSLFYMAGCTGTYSSSIPKGAVVGRANYYDYSPSVILSGTTKQFWWCGYAHNPLQPTQIGDTIFYETIDSATHVDSGPSLVLSETPGTWDSYATCNPHVINGTFTNPLGDGQTYTYEMFYVGTSNINGVDNSIGAAFSNDGITWKKYPGPVIRSSSATAYGVGQPAALNEDEKSSITLYYEDTAPLTFHRKATSPDGVHFTTRGTITLNGLDPHNPQPGGGDMGYDPVTQYWYATYNLPYRDPATTGGNIEHGQYGFQLYRIPASSLLTGSTPWQLVKTIDTNLTGDESNFIPGLLHDAYGNINVGSYPNIQTYPTIANPQTPWNATPFDASIAGSETQWDIGGYEWNASQPLLQLNRYANLIDYVVTTGYIDPNAGYTLNAILGHLYESQQQNANLALFGCKSGANDYFVSKDYACEGQRILGLTGYGYAQPNATLKTVPLYRCTDTGPVHFVSHDPACEGRGPGALLGYALP